LRHLERKYQGQPSAWSNDDSHGSIHERGLCEPSTVGEGERLLGHGRRTADLRRHARRHGTAISSTHDVWVEHPEKRLEVTGARSGQESVDHFSLAGEIGVEDRRPSAHPAACAAGELPGRGRRAPHDGSYLVEGQVEHVVQHERDPLGGGELFEYHEECETDRVGQERLLLGVDPILATHGGRGSEVAEWLLTPRPAGAQHVQAHSRDDRCQPSAEIFHAGRIGAAQMEPGLLHRVVRVTQRPEHPIGHCPQAGPVGLELLCQPFVLVHWSHSLVAIRHRGDERNQVDVTNLDVRHSGSAEEETNPEFTAEVVYGCLRWPLGPEDAAFRQIEAAGAGASRRLS